MLKNKFNIGIIFLLVGLVVLLLKSIFWILGMLIIIIGIILILISKNNWKIKFLWISISLIVTFIFLVIGINLRSSKIKEEIHFSSKLSGRVRILYDNESGIIPTMNGEWSIINVDTNRVLIIKRNERRVIVETKFFIVDEKGIKTPILGINEPNEFREETVVLIDNPSHMINYDVNVQDYTILKKKTDISNKKEINQLDSLSLEKFLQSRVK